MATWHENDDRNDLALWLGKFRDAGSLKEYALRQFRKELGLPQTKYFAITSLEFEYSQQGAEAALSMLLWSKSFLPAALRLAKRNRLQRASGAIAVNSHFTDDDLSSATSRVKFLGYVRFDSSAERACPKPVDHLNKSKFSVWVYTSSDKDRFARYFAIGSGRRTPNRLARDFDIPSYETDFASWVTAREMMLVPLDRLLLKFPIGKKLQRAIVKQASDCGIPSVTAIYMAFELDYEQIDKAAAGRRRSGDVVRYVGTFDSPSLEAQMRTVREREKASINKGGSKKSLGRKKSGKGK
jgi:hypothetical protein